MKSRLHCCEQTVFAHAAGPPSMASSPIHRHWWLIIVLALLAIFLIGVGMTGAIL
jgi:hypothetical protein